LPENVLDRLREIYQARLARSIAALSGGDGGTPIEDPLKGYRRLREDLIGQERTALLELRQEGRLRQDLFRRIQADPDLDEARLRT
jgi:hypothetical protein